MENSGLINLSYQTESICSKYQCIVEQSEATQVEYAEKGLPIRIDERQRTSQNVSIITVETNSIVESEEDNKSETKLVLAGLIVLAVTHNLRLLQSMARVLALFVPSTINCL